jgi:hypothetical protein
MSQTFNKFLEETNTFYVNSNYFRSLVQGAIDINSKITSKNFF